MFLAACPVFACHVTNLLLLLQTLENDLKTGACPSSELVCLVVDECHRATGDHAMANVVKLLREKREKFRVLALSATPGNNHAAIQVGSGCSLNLGPASGMSSVALVLLVHLIYMDCSNPITSFAGCLPVPRK